MGVFLVNDLCVDKVLLMGFVLMGKKVYVVVVLGMKYVMMEFGGKFFLIIFDDVDIENVVGGVINGNFYFLG